MFIKIFAILFSNHILVTLSQIPLPNSEFDTPFLDQTSFIKQNYQINTNPDANAIILHQINNPPIGNGEYNYEYETSNGITANENGVGGVGANGGYSWISPEGIPFSITYVANTLGFQPQGSHLPTAPPEPPKPPHVIKLLEWLQAHPSNDDGSYKIPKLTAGF